jgi:gliding motility-associatede transport system auxiliary component
MNTSWMQARQTKFALYTTVYILIVVVAVGVVNFLANRFNKSVDATSSKKFTLSDQTLKIAKNLKNNVTISYWDQPSKFTGARDLLDRYKNLSTKIDVQYQDTDKKRAQAIAAGVKSQGSIIVDVGAKHEEAKSLTEEEITGALVRALKTGDRTACFVLGSGEHSLDDSGRNGYSNLKTLVEKANYKTQTVKLLEKPEIPKECTIVVVGGPRRDYIQPEIAALKKYVEMDAGRALIMLDPPLKFAQQETDDNKALADLMAEWGVTLDKDLVLDTSGVGELFNMGPEVPLVTTYEGHAIVREMKDIPTGFPIARSLDVKTGAKTAVDKLFSTTNNSFATANLASATIKPSPNDKKGPLTLGAAGTFHTGTDAMNGMFVVVGSSSWVANSFLGFNGNRDLFLNMLNWLSSDEDLISIRPKEQEDRRLVMTRRQSAMVFYSTVIMIPLVIVLAGVGVWWRRR